MKSGNTPLARTLTTAAASGTALFALQHTTDAAVIYNGIGIDLTQSSIFQSPATAGFNINGAAFRGFLSTGDVPFLPQAGRAALGNLDANAAFRFGNTNLGFLGPGEMIGAGGNWTNVTSARLGGFAGPAVTGNWPVGQTGFAGVRFDRGGGNYQYGWIRMKLDNRTGGSNPFDSLSIIDSGYESLLNTPVAAGDMIGTPPPIPEPGNALFALAAAGAAAVRRRRQAA